MPPRTQAFPESKAARAAMPSLGRHPAASTLRRAQRLQKMAVAQRILGIDPGLHRTGYGVIEMLGNQPKLVEGGVLRAKADDPFPLRLQSLYDGLVEVLREHEPEAVVIEELFSTYAHPRSALLMAHARGVLMLAAQQAGVPVHGFTPNEVKQVITGNGHAGKSTVQQAVRARLKLNFVPNPPDVADALAIALCFAMRQDTFQKTA